MNEIKVICKNHGVIQTIPTGVMWVGGVPQPWTHCPHCGGETVIERPEPINYGIYTCQTDEERARAKAKEIAYYRDKYWRGDEINNH